MEFLEGSRGIYRPIRVLFDTTIYDRALQLCWHIKSYKSQIALLMELLKLQQKNQIPSQVTAEDMIDLILERSKNTLRERLWAFELEDFDEDEARPLLMLVWAMNVSNKMRDIEFEAKMLLKSPEAIPPNFQHPKVLSMAKDYAKILRQRQQEASSSKVLSPQEVVMEVVPRVLQGFWVLPPRSLLNMPSQLLSKLSVGVAKATLDRVSSALTTMGHQANFSRSMRDDMVLSILTEIRQMYPHDILVNRIKNFAPVLLSKIADVAAEQICEMFRPQSPKVPARLTTAVESPATTSEEQQTPSPQIISAVVETLLSHPAEPATKVHAREDGSGEPSLEKDVKFSKTPDSAVITPPAEPASKVQNREDVIEEHSQVKDPKPSTEPDTAVVKKLLSHCAEPASKVQAREDGRGGCCGEEDPKAPTEPNTAVVKKLLAQPVEPAFKVQAREESRGEPSWVEDPNPFIEPDIAVVQVAPVPLEHVVIATGDSEVTSTNNRETSFLDFLRPLRCCFLFTDKKTD